ncbi:hypothetical protein [Massilia genomosp. 1]|uniref:DUF1870 family protein n=1 Tax=Massilia genomosp. 1 TaxID=2609280 RepID=A0ABX0N4F0_9BURK|nr:hypothetical protein [Massilia genomosp. 1]NHZ66905.1 hypothetical protein [Massilia genomosp. 1]
MNSAIPLRKARYLLGLTTAEAGQYVHVTRKTWEAWEAKEANGLAVPPAAMELFFSKLDALARRLVDGRQYDSQREMVVVFRRDKGTGGDVPIDVVSTDGYLGNDQDALGYHIIKSLAVDRAGKPYVHRMRYEDAHNQHVLNFCRRHTSVAN